MKKVSVVIPCFNQGKYLQETVNSVKSSTYKNIEIIIVNDGSDDSYTISVLEAINEENIKIININNSGVCNARNIGISASSGEYILTLDGDDKISSDYIEKAVKVLDENPEIGIVYSKAKFFDADNKIVNLKKATVFNMLIQNRIFSASFFRKSKFLEIGGFNSNLEIGCEDWDFWLSIIESGAKVYQIPEVLFFWRKSENIRTKKALNPHNYLKIRLNIIKRHQKLYSKYALIVYPILLFMVLKNFISYCFKMVKGGVK